MESGPSALERAEARVVGCARCPRLVAWRELVASTPSAAHRSEVYWGRPVPGFGDPQARLLVVGLAPGAHGANRTGRMFTGDRSGDFLFAALWRAGYASQATSRDRQDGLELDGAFVTAAVRCAPPENRPTPQERDECAPFLDQELAALGQLRVVLALGAFAFDALCRHGTVGLGAGGPRPGAGGPGARRRVSRKPRFSHGAEYEAALGRTVLCCYHPSQRNVFTGLIDPGMLDAVLRRARELGA